MTCSWYCGRGAAILLVVVVCLVCLIWKADALSESAGTTQRPVKNAAFNTFVTNLRQSKMDLVILIERSTSVDHYNSYNTRALVNNVLRYYTKVGSKNVRFAVASFAMDFIVHFDGMTRNLSKCYTWDMHVNQRKVRSDKVIRHGSNVTLALRKTVGLFKRRSRLPGRSRYLWVLCEKSTGAEFPEMTRDNSISILVTPIRGGGPSVGMPHDRGVYYTGDVPHTAVVLQTIRPLQRLSQLTRFNSSHYCDAYGYIIGTCEGCLYRQRWGSHYLPWRVHLWSNASSMMSWLGTTMYHGCRPDEGSCVCITSNATYPCLTPISYNDMSLSFVAHEDDSVYWTLGGGLCCLILVCLQCIICIVPGKQLEPEASS